MKAVCLFASLVGMVAFSAQGEPSAARPAARPAAVAKPAPVRMGCGIMTFDTVPGRGLDDQGLAQIGPTHGGVAIDSRGLVSTSADAEGIEINAETGAVVLELPFPEESGRELATFAPTAITEAPNGDIFLSDGYASNHIFPFDKTGKHLEHFGTKGNDLERFNTAHGMTLDTRYDPPRLLICDRNHQPRGRLLHYGLDGTFLGEVVTGLGMPTSAAVQGDYVSVPDLQGRLVNLDKTNTIMAVLGHNPDRARGQNCQVPREKWIEGVFGGTHGSAWDAKGTLYVQDWNIAGRIMKLARVG